jgi:hypothetical protein
MPVIGSTFKADIIIIKERSPLVHICVWMPLPGLADASNKFFLATMLKGSEEMLASKHKSKYSILEALRIAGKHRNPPLSKTILAECSGFMKRRWVPKERE